jgi:hypothetical protein
VDVTAGRKPKLKNPHAVALGTLGGKRRAEVLTVDQKQDIAKKGGLVGGKARARSLSKAQRSKIARIAAEARWKKEKGPNRPD